MKPLVSILIPAFNADRWIAESIESALRQTWSPTEVIVVDDGSVDETLAVARKFESCGVTIVTQKNQGAAAARNRAFALSRGDYIQWLDADDLLAPDKVADQMAALDKKDSRLLLSGPWGEFFYRHSHAIFSPTPLWADLSPVDWLIEKMGENLHMQTATWLVSREMTEAAGPWNVNLLGDDDGEYFCRVLLRSRGVKFVPSARVFYRSAGSSSLSYIGRSAAKIEAQFHSMQLHIGYLRSLEDGPRVRAACIQYLQNWLLDFYPERLDIVRQAQRLAEALGGRLELPQFSWKYSWIQALGGPTLAKRGQVFSRQLRWSMVRSWDKMLFQLENWSRTKHPEPRPAPPSKPPPVKTMNPSTTLPES